MSRAARMVVRQAEETAARQALAKGQLSDDEVARIVDLRRRRGLSVASLAKVTGHPAHLICAALGLPPAFARA